MIQHPKKIRTLLVLFQNEMRPGMVSSFRGAVIEKVGRQNILFNHHIGDREYLYEYPKIQYKTIRKQPAIFCLGEGVDEIHKLFSKKDWIIQLNGQPFELIIGKLDLNTITLNVWDKMYQYKLKNWLGLNSKNYLLYNQLKNSDEKKVFLERILTGNILSFAKGMDWHVPVMITVKIDEIERECTLTYKQVRFQGFDISFACNVYLPLYIGLGKGASHGFGIIKKIVKKENEA